MNHTLESFKVGLKQLVDQFSDNEKYYISKDYLEADVRAEFIDKFFALLNWDMGGAVRPGETRDVIREKGKTSGKPDYSFRMNGQTKFFVEAKAPNINIKGKEINQAINYAWNHSEVSFSILTNFKEFHLYDVSLKPDEKHPEASEIFNIQYEQYLEEENLAKLWTLSYDEVKNGSLEKYLKKDPASRKRRIPVDESILADLTVWREMLAKSAKKHDLNLSTGALNEVVQMFLDRLIFIRIAEDRRIVREETLKQCVEEWEQGKHRSLRKTKLNPLFKRVNDSLNGRVLRPSEALEASEFDDQLIADIIQGLYGVYDFSVIGVELLGSIYERYLGKTISVTAKRVKVEDKPEVRKAGGVYYTPKYIVDYIVENTVGKYLAGKGPDELSGNGFRVLDMACGSGSFLLGAYQYLLDYYLQWYIANKPEKHRNAVWKMGDGWRLTTLKRRDILIDHIFGVDIDPQAVEITMMSLYIKQLEGEDEETILRGQQGSLPLGRALPNLDNNIKCGNSLIGIDYINGRFDFENGEFERVRPFDWATQFPEAMKNGGFDCVIGNPPYLNIDEVWGKKDSRLAAIKSLYKDIYNDKTDIIFYFLAKAAKLAKGNVGFIISRAFLEAYKADKLRRYLLNNSAISKIIDFQNFYVFPKVGITTSVIILKPKGRSETISVHKLISDLNKPYNLEKDVLDANVFLNLNVQQSSLSEKPWVFVPQKISELNNRIDEMGDPLGNILIIGEGMQTGRNNVFGERTYQEIKKWGVKLGSILIIGKGMETGRNNVFGERTYREIKKWGVKSGMFYKRATNSDIERFFIRDRGQFILYLEDIEKFERLPVGVRNYLLENADDLKARAAYKRGDCEWWKYTWPLHKEYWSRNKLICPYMAKSNRFAIDTNNEFLGLTDTTVFFDNEQRESLLYLLGLLNSKLLTFRFRSIGKLKSGGIFEYFENQVSKLPIRRIDFSNAKDVQRHDLMVNLVNTMLNLKKKAGKAQSEIDRKMYIDLMDAKDGEIDRLVYDLYGIKDKKDRQIIEDSLNEKS